MQYKPSYGEGVKALTFETFRRIHKHIGYYQYFEEADWEAEYEKATGKKVKHAENKKGE